MHGDLLSHDDVHAKPDMDIVGLGMHVGNHGEWAWSFVCMYVMMTKVVFFRRCELRLVGFVCMHACTYACMCACMYSPQELGLGP
jgi:hypothetical protein